VVGAGALLIGCLPWPLHSVELGSDPIAATASARSIRALRRLCSLLLAPSAQARRLISISRLEFQCFFCGLRPFKTNNKPTTALASCQYTVARGRRE
jgi:hypothetical protein